MINGQKKSHLTKSGTKEYFSCSIYSKCKARMQLHCLNDDQRVCMLRNNVDHQHDHLDQHKRIRKEIKEMIIELFNLRVTAPLNIIYALRIKGLVNVPKQRQITNFLSRYRCKNIRKPSISYFEIEKWCKSNLEIPDNPNKLFVLRNQVKSGDSPYIRITASTKYLLELGTNNIDFCCTDATYKLIYQGHPVIIVGHVDKARRFHPISLSITTTEKNEDFTYIFDSINKYYLILFN